MKKHDATLRPTKQRPYFAIRAVDRAFDVLDALLEADTELGLPELTQRVGLAKSTVHRLLCALAERRLVTRNEATGNYQLGGRLLRYSVRILESADIVTAAKPIIERLAVEIGEGIRIHVWEHDQVVVVASAGGSRYYRLAHQIGMTLPPQRTACGRAIVAFMDSTVAERVARERGPDGQFLVRPAIWLKQLDEVRRLGLAFSRGELDSALNAISAPIFGKQSQIMGAITIAAPAPRLLTTAESSYAQALRQAAANISMELGCIDYPFSLKRSSAITTTKGDHGRHGQRR